MEKINWKKLKHNTLSTVLAFPVEIALSVCFFVFVVLSEEHHCPKEETRPFLVYLPLFWILSFSLNHFFAQGRKRWIYFSSIVFPLFIPLITVEPFEITYAMIWLIALAVLLTCRRQNDNFFFTLDSLRLPFHVSIAGILTLSLSFLLWGIYASLDYIFDVELFKLDRVVFYLFLFPLSIIAPFLFCLFQRLDQNKYNWMPNTFFKILNNWIVSPALIAYTALLYIYGLKILFTWDLPKGMLSYMVAVFLFIAVVARALQELLVRKHYNWYYNKFNLIAIPVLILFWIGIIYRISEYGFTESRVFLFALALLLTYITLASVGSNKTRYLHFIYLVLILLAPITFIPPLSANKIGLISQEKRLKKTIDAFRLRDPETGLIRNATVPESLDADSSEELYQTMTDTFYYILSRTSPSYMEKKFGYSSIEALNWELFEGDKPEYLREDNFSNSAYYYKPNRYNMPIGEYNELIIDNFSPVIRNDSVILMKDSLVVTTFDIEKFFSEYPDLREENEGERETVRLFYLRNDSYVASIDNITIRDGKLDYLSIDFLFKK